METGKVVEIIGAVIDVQFPREAMPNIFDALLIEEGDLTLEVQQQIGDGICLLYTSPSPRDATLSRMPSSA